jgi:hypothetical protein
MIFNWFNEGIKPWGENRFKKIPDAGPPMGHALA